MRKKRDVLYVSVCVCVSNVVSQISTERCDAQPTNQLTKFQ